MVKVLKSGTDESARYIAVEYNASTAILKKSETGDVRFESWVDAPANRDEREAIADEIVKAVSDSALLTSNFPLDAQPMRFTDRDGSRFALLTAGGAEFDFSN